MQQLCTTIAAKFKTKIQGTLIGMILADSEIECRIPGVIEIISPDITTSELIAKSMLEICDLAEDLANEIQLKVVGSRAKPPSFPVYDLLRVYSEEREIAKKMIQSAQQSIVRSQPYHGIMDAIAAQNDYVFLLDESGTYLDYRVPDVLVYIVTGKQIGRAHV